ncbi:hypothetical protein SAMN04488498_110189 [Mesorhizobium albiziae]|uniref:Thoeris anti-defense 2-like domain-containing protein n=2 Tax=Neomesorhizobium albiziae TaxID=335020 RepID=A0A1I4BKI9_9HYPH|nr:hypothetical protein [Mesorhizobium albiziae]SFK68870.1 hypothetical protein SAMN04488498_110189 [Mesorhizobium albiziae]
MDFPTAMAATIAGAAVRRSTWGARRMVRLTVAPWSGDEALLMLDRMNKGDVPPYPYHPSGADVRGTDWMTIEDSKV